MFHSIYQFGIRNGLALHPDNGKRLPGGKQVMTDEGRAELKPGERRAKWLGKTWKSKLYIEDREEIERYAKVRLVETLKGCLAQKRREEDDMRKPRRKLGLRKRLWVAALVAAIVLTAGSIYNYSFLQDGYAILRNEGPSAAFEFFQNHGETYDNLFGQAWAAYRNGDYEISKTLGNRVLKSNQFKDKARASFLLGTIATTEGDFDQAQEDLLTALALYENLGQPKSQARTQLALAKLYLAQKDIDNAVYYTNLTELNGDAWEDQYFLFIKSQIAFHKNDFEQALQLAMLREPLVKDDDSQLGGVYEDIGFYSCLIGEFDQCFDYTMKAQVLAQKLASEKLLMYNQVNFYLFMKCNLRDVSIYRDTTLEYARKNHDVKLLEYLYFVDKFSCPIPRPDPGDPDPPDDPNDPPPKHQRLSSGQWLSPESPTKANDPPPE